MESSSCVKNEAKTPSKFQMPEKNMALPKLHLWFKQKLVTEVKEPTLNLQIGNPYDIAYLIKCIHTQLKCRFGLDWSMVILRIHCNKQSIYENV